MGSMKIMDKSGHSEQVYALEDVKKVAEAKQTFEAKMVQGYAPFVKLEDGSYAQVQRERFDAREDYLLIPAVAGG